MTEELDALVRQNTIDSRELLERLDELEDWLDREVSTSPTVEERAELEELRELQSETENYAESWGDGITFIADSYFEEYAEELAYDIGAISRDADWPLTNIDWKGAADDLKTDYTSTEIRGVTFWYR